MKFQTSKDHRMKLALTTFSHANDGIWMRAVDHVNENMQIKVIN